MRTEAEWIIDELEDIANRCEERIRREPATAGESVPRMLVELLRLGVKVARQANAEGAFDD